MVSVVKQKCTTVIIEKCTTLHHKVGFSVSSRTSIGSRDGAAALTARGRSYWALLLAAQALPEAVALPVHGQDVRPVGEAVEKGGGQSFVAEHPRPL